MPPSDVRGDSRYQISAAEAKLLKKRSWSRKLEPLDETKSIDTSDFWDVMSDDYMRPPSAHKKLQPIALRENGCHQGEAPHIRTKSVNGNLASGSDENVDRGVTRRPTTGGRIVKTIEQMGSTATVDFLATPKRPHRYRSRENQVPVIPPLSFANDTTGEDVTKGNKPPANVIRIRKSTGPVQRSIAIEPKPSPWIRLMTQFKQFYFPDQHVTETKRWQQLITVVTILRYGVRNMVRKHREHKHCLKCQKCATRIQSRFRSHQAVRSYHRTKQRSVDIQRFIRGYLARKRYICIRNKRQQSAMLLQKHIRGYHTRKAIQPQIHLRKQTRCAVKIQSGIRGYHCRRKYLFELAAKKQKEETQKKRVREQQKQKAVERLQRGWRFHRNRVQARISRQYLKKLPFECRKLWMKFNALKEDTSKLKKEFRNLALMERD
eukprot:GILJ01009124.1.p1 GENE.GILJ01009124.1~~GILJ01009124.1.p1  ORF type:complete len:434 (+),score=54.51 GILJ01009124.1:83-1384(+)